MDTHNMAIYLYNCLFFLSFEGYIMNEIESQAEPPMVASYSSRKAPHLKNTHFRCLHTRCKGNCFFSWHVGLSHISFSCFFSFLKEKSPKSTNETAVKKAEDVVSTMLAKGYVLGKDAINKAKAFDEQHHLTSNASATVASLDRKMGLSLKLSIGTAVVNEKMREMDEKFQVSEKTKSVFAAAEQKASSAGSALMSNPYVSTGASWVSNALSAVARAAEDVSTMTKEKVEKAEEEKKETLIKDSVEIINGLADNHQDDQSPTTAPPLVPIDSSDRKLGNI